LKHIIVIYLMCIHISKYRWLAPVTNSLLASKADPQLGISPRRHDLHNFKQHFLDHPTTRKWLICFDSNMLWPNYIYIWNNPVEGLMMTRAISYLQWARYSFKWFDINSLALHRHLGASYFTISQFSLWPQNNGAIKKVRLNRFLYNFLGEW
jgi:hypothetical protein